MNAGNEFTAPWTSTLRIMTVLISLLIWGMAVGLFATNRDMLWFSAFLLLGAWVVPLLNMVRGYRLERRTLVIRRLCWDTRVDIGDMASVELIPKEHIQGSWRLFGNGGLFAACGWFWNRKLGRYRAWVTDDERLVLIQCSDRKLVVSPGQPDEFVRELRAGCSW